MTLYTVQAPGLDAESLAKARFIPDGFSKPAFVFAQLWLLYHRLWIALLVWIALEAGFFAFVFPHVSAATAIAVDLLARLFLGLEGNRLRYRKAAAMTDVVEARDRDEAEAIFYRRHLDGAAGANPA